MGIIRFSDYFGINKSQAELDFVDIPLNTDIELYVDPFAIFLDKDIWFNKCNNLIIDFFDRLIYELKNNNKSKALELMGNLSEANDANLGLSKGIPDGKGIGKKYGLLLYKKLNNSKAVKTGKVEDISDLELLIPGISNDRISDMTINIIRGMLIAYTYNQCKLYDIEMKKIASGMYWDDGIGFWRNAFVYLPVYEGKRIILVPKVSVRYRIRTNHKEYYNKFVLDFLQAEHLRANSSLVHVLKNKKRKVLKKDLKEKYPCTKEFLFEFSNKNSRVLREYKKYIIDNAGNELDNEAIEERQKEPREIDLMYLIDKLKEIKYGKKEANRYHECIKGIIVALFSPELYKIKKEKNIDRGLKRLDLVANNRAKRGFFNRISNIHRILCPKIIIECKNYKEDPKNPELDQLLGRLGKKRSHFGILACRNIKDKKRLLERCKIILENHGRYIIVIEDKDIFELIKLKNYKKIKEFDDYMDDKLSELIM